STALPTSSANHAERGTSGNSALPLPPPATRTSIAANSALVTGFRGQKSVPVGSQPLITDIPTRRSIADSCSDESSSLNVPRVGCGATVPVADVDVVDVVAADAPLEMRASVMKISDVAGDTSPCQE